MTGWASSFRTSRSFETSLYISRELNFCFHYFFMRKLWFAQIAKALIVFPGGFGTMDELWEMLTLLQTGKLSSHHMILIYGRKYWDKVIDWRHMVRTGTIDERDYKLLEFADTVDEALSIPRACAEMEKPPSGSGRHLALWRLSEYKAASGGDTRPWQIRTAGNRASPGDGSVRGDFWIGQKYGVEPALLTLVVEQHHR